MRTPERGVDPKREAADDGDGLATGRGILLLNAGWVWTTPCVAEKRFGVPTEGRHHDDAVD